jgi:hypothetical protein
MFITTLTIHLDNEKSEQTIEAVLDALGVKYDETGEQPAFPDHIVAGVRKSQEDLKAGRCERLQRTQRYIGATLIWH